MTKTFSADVDAQVRRIDALMTAVFRTAVQDTVEEILTPGPSVASVKKAISKGLGSRGRGKNRAAIQGPVFEPGGGGNLPVDTGYLRATFNLSEGAPELRRISFVEGRDYRDNVAPYALVIAGSTGDQPLYATFSAAYAASIEFGGVGRPARGFVRLAAQNWQSNVNKAVTKVRSKGIPSG